MHTRFIERSTSMARGKRASDPSDAMEGQPENKRPALASVIVEALKMDTLQRLCSSLEPIFRKIVSEEVERALAKLGPAKLGGRSSPKQLEGPDGRKLQLHFKTRLSLPLFTGGKVDGEHGAAIHIVLIDATNGHVVTFGPESSAKLDVVVLEGDFNNEDDDDWTEEEFESHVVKEREGKRPLLTGDLQVTLKEGLGTLGELIFTDNSSWIRSRKFRLGLKVVSGYCEGIRIREAKTEDFTVKDHRGELYKKHYPPALMDEVWRLEKIGKEGAFHKRLNKAGIFSVEDFLRLVVRDPQRLRNILGSGMSNKMWETLVEHANSCVLSGKLYVYYPDDSKNLGVVFNNIYELSGLITNSRYSPADSLSESEKIIVDNLVKKAYENWMHVVEYDGKSLGTFKQSRKADAFEASLTMGQHDYSSCFNSQRSLPSHPVTVHPEPLSMPSGPTVGGDHNRSLDGGYNLQQPHTADQSTPTHFEGTTLTLQNQHVFGSQLPRGEFPPVMGASQLGFQGVGTTGFGFSRGEMEDYFPEEEIRARSHEMLENEDMQHLLRLFDGGHASVTGNEDGVGYPSSYMPAQTLNYGFNGDRGHSSGKAVIGWLKLKAALRWGIFVRKKAAERRAHLVELDEP